MSDSPVLDLQKAVVGALKGSSLVGTLIGDKIYDGVPEGVVFPYVSIGPTEEASTPYDCIDGRELFMQIDAWSRSYGSPEVKRIAGAVRDTLHDADLVLDDFGTVLIEHERTRFITEQDGKTWHGIISIRALVE